MLTRKILIADLVGTTLNQHHQPDHDPVKRHIEAKGGVFHLGPLTAKTKLEQAHLHFFYQPQLATPEDILAQCRDGQYDAVIAAATHIPAEATFECGGVRIGAGTGNMGSHSWGGSDGQGGQAPLMNTPSFNARATAQMVFKQLLALVPDVDLGTMHKRVLTGLFCTARDLIDFPTTRLAGKKIAVLGFGHIGSEVAKLAKAFAMDVTVYARAKHQHWIESLGYRYAPTPMAAVADAEVISPHLGLGVNGGNIGIFDKNLLGAVRKGCILINFDRAELIERDGLAWALKKEIIGFCAIDADIFLDDKGVAFGPLAPFVELAKAYPGRLRLLPHVAADTEHHSRVEGAMAAVDQIVDAIEHRRIGNRVGSLPPGYEDAGPKTVLGVGKVREQHVLALDDAKKAHLAELALEVAQFWQGHHQDAAKATEAANCLMSEMTRLGLIGPYES